MSSDQLAVAAGLISLLSLIASLTQLWRTRRHVEQVAARAATLLADDIFALIIDRMKLRFAPSLLKSDGLMLRERRTMAALNYLSEIKLAELPARAVQSFIQFRSHAEALNAEMNSEKMDEEVRLDQYAKLFRNLREHFQQLQRALSSQAKLDLVKHDWNPPQTYKRLIWNEHSA